MAYTTINKSSEHFNTKLYTGTGADGNAQTGVGFQPDFVWIKQRNAMSHRLYDAIRGVNSALLSNQTDAENQYPAYGQFESFDSDGFTVGAGTTNGHGTNENGQNIVSWNWKAGTGQGSSNTDGSINTTYTSVNTTAGFSISTYTGTGSNATIGHGLGVAPEFIITKQLSSTQDWNVQATLLGYSKYLVLNSNVAQANTSGALISSVSSSTVTVDGNSQVNGSGATYVMYCFASKTGYSKFGTYVGNGNADGSFIYTGFKPAFIMLKNASSAGTNWFMHDAARNPSNPIGYYLTADNNTADQTTDLFDIVSNGFKQRNSYANLNGSGDTYIYMTFAEAPLVGSNNTPCTAR